MCDVRGVSARQAGEEAHCDEENYLPYIGGTRAGSAGGGGRHAQVSLQTNNKPCSITAVDPNLRRPYATSWNLSVQHAISNDLSLQVAYVGTHATGLIGLNDINAPQPGAGWLTGPTCNTPFAASAIAGASASATCENLDRPYFSKFPYLSSIVRISNQDFSNYKRRWIAASRPFIPGTPIRQRSPSMGAGPRTDRCCCRRL
jgi:hypothetical protein